MNRTLNVLLGAAVIAAIGGGVASAQTGSLQGRRTILNDGGLTPGTYNRITLTTPVDATLTGDYQLLLPPNDGNANDIIFTPDGTGTLEFTDGNGLFWRLLGNYTTNPLIHHVGTNDGQDVRIGTTDPGLVGAGNGDLIMITLGTERARILGSDGSMGLGATPNNFYRLYSVAEVGEIAGYFEAVSASIPALVAQNTDPAGVGIGVIANDLGIWVGPAFAPTPMVGVSINAQAVGLLVNDGATPPAAVGISVEGSPTGIFIDDASSVAVDIEDSDIGLRVRDAGLYGLDVAANTNYVRGGLIVFDDGTAASSPNSTTLNVIAGSSQGTNELIRFETNGLTTLAGLNMPAPGVGRLFVGSLANDSRVQLFNGAPGGSALINVEASLATQRDYQIPTIEDAGDFVVAIGQGNAGDLLLSNGNDNRALWVGPAIAEQGVSYGFETEWAFRLGSTTNTGVPLEVNRFVNLANLDLTFTTNGGASTLVLMDGDAANGSVDITSYGTGINNITGTTQINEVNFASPSGDISDVGGAVTVVDDFTQTGITLINTTGTAATTIGSLTNTSSVIVRANNDITIDVAATTNDLVLNNILDVAPGANDDVMWITDGTNYTRRTSFSTLVNEGLQYQNSAIRLGANAVDVNPVVSGRLVTIGAAGTLTYTTAGGANNMLVLNNNGNVQISATGAATTAIGSASAGTISLNAGGATNDVTVAAADDITLTANDVISTSTATTQINPSGTATTSIGSATSGTISLNAGGAGNDVTVAAADDITLTATDVISTSSATTQINPTGTATTSIGSATGGTVSVNAGGAGNDVTVNAADDFTVTANDISMTSTVAATINTTGAGSTTIGTNGNATSLLSNTVDVGTGAYATTIGIGTVTNATVNILGADVNVNTSGSGTTDIGNAAAGTITMNAGGAGSDLDIDAADAITINSATLAAVTTTSASVTTPALTLTGNTSANINTTGTGTTTIGHNAGGQVTAHGNGVNGLRLFGNGTAAGDNTIVVDPGELSATPGDEYDLVLNNIRLENPIQDLLWITTNNEVRRANFTLTANEGVQFQSSAFRLGSNAIDVNPIVSSRFVTVGAAGTLTFNSAALANNMLTLNNNGNVTISSVGAGTTSIGGLSAGTISLNAGGTGNDVDIDANDDITLDAADITATGTTTVSLVAPTANVNNSGTGVTNIGNATAGTITINAGGLGNDVDVDAADLVNIDAGTMININTTDPSSNTQIGALTNTGTIGILANNDVTINVAATSNDLVLQNIASTLTPINMLSIDGSGNVRQTPVTGTADEGLMWDAVTGDYKLGHTTDGTNPITQSRFVRIGGGGTLTFNNGSFTQLSMANGGAVTINGTPLNMNTTGTGNTAIGNATGTFQLTSNELNISAAGVITDALSAVQISDDLATTATTVFGDGTGIDNSTFNLGAGGTISVNNGVVADLIIDEVSISRGNADIAINPGAANLVSTNGSLTVAVNATVTNNLTVTNGSATVTAGNLTVTGGNFNVLNAGSNNTIEGSLNANGNTNIGNSATDAITVKGVVNINDLNGAATTNIGTNGTSGNVTIGSANNTVILGGITDHNRGVNVPVQTFPGAGPYNLTDDNYVAICNNVGNETLNLPSPVGREGRLIVVKVANAGNVTVQSAGGATVDGVLSIVIGGGGNLSRTFVSDGTNWFVIGN